MKLLTGYYDSNLKLVKEDFGAGNAAEKRHFIEGVFMQADRQNRNRRVYPLETLKRAVDRYINEQVITGRAVGELNHPEGPSINLDKVSHRIVDLRWEGNNVIGKALILDTPMGNIAKGLLNGGVKLGVSSRGMGDVEMKKEGYSVVKDNFYLNTIDIVQDPSAPEAFVNGILEGVEFFIDDGKIMAQQALDETKKKLHKLSLSQITENQCAIFEEFLRKISIKPI